MNRRIYELTKKLGQLEPDALAVVEQITERLIEGRKQYGPLRLREDSRDWRKEGSEEALDLAVYLAADLLDPRTPNTKKETER